MKLSQIDAIQFLKNFQSIASCVSKRETRPILTCVNTVIDFRDNTLTMLATDSAILAKRTDKMNGIVVENPEGFNHVSLNIPAESFIKTLKTFIPKKAKYCLLEIEYDEADKENIKLTIDHTKTNLQINTQEYPHIQSHFDEYNKHFTQTEDFRVVSIGTPLLKSLIEYSEKMGSDSVTIALPGQPGEFMKPFAFKISKNYGDTYGIITPLRTH